MMSAVKVSLSNRNKIPPLATSLSTKQLCRTPGDDRYDYGSYTYISRIGNPHDVCWSYSYVVAKTTSGWLVSVVTSKKYRFVQNVQRHSFF